MKLRTIGIAAVVMVSAAAVIASVNEYTLRRAAKVGDKVAYRLTADVEVMGQSASFTARVDEKIIKVEDNGNYVVESTQTEGKIKFGDQEMDAPSSGATTTKHNASGEVLEITGEEVNEDVYRLAAMNALPYEDKKYKVGDKIEWQVKPSAKNGNTAGKGSGEIKAVETINGTECVVVEVSYKEAVGSEPAESAGKAWQSTKDGSLVRFEGSYKNAPFPGAPGPINAKIKMERI